MKLKQLIIIACSVVLLLLGSCSKLNDDFNGLLDNPNAPSSNSADADLLLNNVELSFVSFARGLSAYGEQLTRMTVFYGPTYDNAYYPTSFDGVWSTAYTSIFKNIDAMMLVADEKYMHQGIAKTLKAYTLMTLVDCFGDVPYTEANKGIEVPNPVADAGGTIYAGAITLLDEAIADFAQSAPAPSNDLFYDGDGTKWATLAKTLKLKAYVQTRLVDASVKSGIQALLDEGDLIDDVSEDFEFKYSSQSQAPDSRDPRYSGNYTATGSGDYMGNYFMWAMHEEKGMTDPRIRYCFYRQTLDIEADIPDLTTLQFTIPCLFRAYPANYPEGTPFCMLSNGYFGRDHGNNEGIPPDNQFRTTWGIYPAGGEFDADQGSAVSAGIGGQGQGIFPIWQSAYTYFLEAEAALILETSGDAESLMESGIRASFSKILGYPATIGVSVNESYVPTETEKNDYVDYVKDIYESAGSSDAMLDIIIKEYYLALWGNGIEPFNNYRRTGKPANMQPVLQTNPGPFIRSYIYPNVYVSLNLNAEQKANNLVKVFWDTNPDDFIK